MSFLIYDCDSLRAKQNVKWLVKILTWQAKCVLGHFSLVQLIVIPWTVPRQAPLHWILQARILEWVAISFSRGSSQLRDRTQVSCIAGRFFTI